MPPTALPTDWPQLSSALFYDDPRAAIEFLRRAFGFEVKILVDGPNGGVAHSELVFQRALVMVASAKRDARCGSPRSVDGRNTQSLMLYVEDVDAHCARARAAGARITAEPADQDYGPDHWVDRGYEAVDPEGHRWWFSQRLRDAR